MAFFVLLLLLLLEAKLSQAPHRNWNCTCSQTPTRKQKDLFFVVSYNLFLTSYLLCALKMCPKKKTYLITKIFICVSSRFSPLKSQSSYRYSLQQISVERQGTPSFLLFVLYPFACTGFIISMAHLVSFRCGTHVPWLIEPAKNTTKT